jgi:hypothetical protein
VHRRQQSVGSVRRLLDHALDRGEVEALGLELADQLQAPDVLGPVITHSLVHHRRLQQVARPVRTDVADGEARLGRKLLDRERMIGRRARHLAVE